MIGKICRLILGNIYMTTKILLGTRLSFSIINLVSPLSTLRTYGKGEIILKNKVEIRPNTEVTARNGIVEIGETSFINRNCMIVSHNHIVIGNHVTIGPGTYIYDHDHDGSGGFVTKKVRIGDNTWIGAGCIILKGVNIGKNVVIAAGTIVSKDVSDNNTVFQKRITTTK